MIDEDRIEPDDSDDRPEPLDTEDPIVKALVNAGAADAAKVVPSDVADEDKTVANVDVLHETDWIVALGPTGTGKTTVMTYYLHWYLDKNVDWIEAIYSTTPFFEGNLFDENYYPYNIYPYEDESAGKDYLNFGLPESEWPAIRVDDPHIFTPRSPFTGHDGQIYYRPKLHHLLRPLGQLRNIDRIRNCIFFGDELGNLLPARNYKDQRQWLITKMAKDFRRHNVIFLATDQYNKAFDIQLRENFSQVVRPLLTSREDAVRWEYYTCKDDPDFTNYRMHLGYLVYPEEDREGDGFNSYDKYPPRSAVYRFFDSKHAVPIAFNEPMNDAKLSWEGEQFGKWLLSTNYFRILAKLWKDDKPVDPGFNVFDRCVKAWNHQQQKYYN